MVGAISRASLGLRAGVYGVALGSEEVGRLITGLLQ